MQVLNGQCLAYFLADYPKEVNILLGKKGLNSQKSYILLLFENEPDPPLECSQAQEQLNI